MLHRVTTIKLAGVWLVLLLATVAGCTPDQLVRRDSTPSPAAAPSSNDVAAAAPAPAPPQDPGAAAEPTPSTTAAPPYSGCLAEAATPRPVSVWGLAGLRGYVCGQEIAPNGQEYNQLFSLDFNFNLMLWRDQGLYAFAETRFWGERATPGVTNVHQGEFDFSKREFDFNLGAAWNYYDAFEARVFAYSLNNLNRGTSVVRPTGYDDGFGLENRYYIGSTYADLGTDAFDTAKATFLSVGYFPTKNMVDGNGLPFKPGPFARAYLTLDLFTEWLYAYLDAQVICRKSFTPELLYWDAGVALRPFAKIPRLEFRLGSENNYDMRENELETSLYGAVRFIY